MRIQVTTGRTRGVQVIGAFSGKNGIGKLVPAAKSRGISTLVSESGFRAVANESALLPVKGGWVLIVGLGKEGDLSPERLRQFAGTAAKVAGARAIEQLVLPVLRYRALGSADAAAQALVEGALLGLYRYDRYKPVPKDERSKLNGLVLSPERAGDVAAVKRGVVRGQAIAEGVRLARDLINGPSNYVTPTHLADTAKRIAKASRISCQVLSFPELKRRGFGGIVGVAQGSHHPAKFIILDYKPARARKTFALCGKGITFDTGGISLKPSAKMELMKYDMSGAAAVLGTVQAAAVLKLPVRIIGIIAATENMPGGGAQKPSDIIKTLSGKTVEVLNTDAEGRLVLSDCLFYAQRYKADAIIDLATLTGACVVALGSEAIGLVSNNDTVAQRVEASGRATHERVWRLPAWKEYGQMMKSRIADLQNITNTGEAGTITAGKFLEEFVGGQPWAHLDIAGTAWTDKEKPYVPRGPVGIGVRLLIHLMEHWK